MRQVLDLTSQALRNAQQPRESKPSDSLAAGLLSNLWERMTHMFGHRWTATFGESATSNGALTEVAKTWGAGLRGLTGEDIAAGLRSCAASGEDWPPSLPQFRAMCKQTVEPVENAEMYRVQPKALPEPDWRKTERKAKGSEACSGLRSMLRSGGHD